MKKIIVVAILSTLSLPVTGCGPTASLIVASSLATTKATNDVLEGVAEGVAKGTSCALAGMFGYPTITVRFTEQEMRELLGAMDAAKIRNAKKFWPSLPPAMAEEVKSRIYQKYEAGSIYGSFERQPIEFFTDLFARGMLWYSRQKVPSSRADVSRAVIEHYVDVNGRKSKVLTAYGISIQAAGFPEPGEKGQSIRFCR